MPDIPADRSTAAAFEVGGSVSEVIVVDGNRDWVRGDFVMI